MRLLKNSQGEKRTDRGVRPIEQSQLRPARRRPEGNLLKKKGFWKGCSPNLRNSVESYRTTMKLLKRTKPEGLFLNLLPKKKKVFPMVGVFAQSQGENKSSQNYDCQSRRSVVRFSGRSLTRSSQNVCLILELAFSLCIR